MTFNCSLNFSKDSNRSFQTSDLDTVGMKAFGVVWCCVIPGEVLDGKLGVLVKFNKPR